MKQDASAREHLFVSYAWENAALADWLTLKLTASGYRVWCDRFKLLGGDPWPTDIDQAIKNDTFRVLHLLSEHSLNKPNPVKERELALAIARDRGPSDFLIPLNVDGLKPSELTWRLSDTTFIPFESWSGGLAQLLKKLEMVDAPRPLEGTGGEVAASAYLPPDVLAPTPEAIFTNCVALTEIPKALYRYESRYPLSLTEQRLLQPSWPFRAVDERLFVAFGPPPEGLPGHIRFREAGAFLWAADRTAHGINTRNLVSELVKKAAAVCLVGKGLQWTDRGDGLFIPPGVLPDDQVKFTGYNGRRTYVQAGGERAFGDTRFRYRLGVSLYVRQDVLDGFVLILRPRLRITDLEDKELDPRQAFVRRKRTARSWFNHEWSLRTLALFSLFGDTREILRNPSGHQLALAPELLGASLAPGINEARLLDLGHSEADPPPDFDDEEEEDEDDAAESASEEHA